MCGLVAVISKSYNGFTIKEKDIFDELLYIDALRGEDSTGVMAIDTDGNLELAKEASASGYFQLSDEYKKLTTGAVRNGAALVGHNRKATKGNITDENAHPFVVDDRVVLVHNGTLYGDHKKIADTEVDSHAIAHLIHQKGDDVEAALKELNGAYALIWYDVQAKTMNFVRNSQRPLCFIETFNSWIWASEPGMLSWILSRNQIAPLQGAKITMLPEGELYTYKRGTTQWKLDIRKLDLTKKVEYTEADWYAGTGGHGDACAYSGDGVLRRSRHWMETDEDYVHKPTQTMATAMATAVNRTLTLPPTRTQQAANTTPITAVNSSFNVVSVKVYPNEASLARKGGFITDIDRFQAVLGAYSANNWVTGSVVDYDYVRGDTVGGGVFLYARLWDHPDILIRCYVPYEVLPNQSQENFELHIIKLVTEEAKLAFKIGFKSWHPFKKDGNSMNDKDGFSILYCTEYQPITINLVNNEKEVDRAAG